MKSFLLDLWISKKILINGSKSRFISFIGLSSILGISIGVMALIVVMSVMNGFHYELKKRILDATSHIEIYGGLDDQDKFNELSNRLDNISSIDAYASFINGEGLISNSTNNHGIQIRGVDPEKEGQVNHLFEKIVIGSKILNNDRYEMIIGIDLARIMDVQVGDYINLLIPKLNFGPIGSYPVIKKFIISGIFDAGIYEFDSSLALISQENARKIFYKNTNTLYSGIQIQLKNSDETLPTESQVKQILYDLNINAFVNNWTNKNKNFFSAIQMEKRVMAIILTLIIAVAAFNLIASLTMSVYDRKKDIAILQTIGFSKLHIVRIFVMQGFIIGLIGSFVGLLLGVLIASNINNIVPFIERIFNIQFLSKDIYYINELPSMIMISDINFVVFVSIILALMATIYPSYVASKINPAEVLKNE
jgi:lipoprotein-releasing system permease protein